MGQFKPMTKMMTTEPSVILKLKKGGKVTHKADGGFMPMQSTMPAQAPMGMPARGGSAPSAGPMRPPMAARRRAMNPNLLMKKGGKAEKHEDAAQDRAMIKKAMAGKKFAEGGLAKSGIIKTITNKTTKMVDGDKKDTAKGTKGVKEGQPAGFATGGVIDGKPAGYKAGGKAKGVGNAVEGNEGKFTNNNVDDGDKFDSATGTTGVRNGNAGGFKKGGSTKKAYATGGNVVDDGKAEKMPRHFVSRPVANSLQSGTFKKGGKVAKFSKAGPVDAKEISDKASRELEEALNPLGMIKEGYGKVRDFVKEKMAPAGSVTETQKSVTVAPPTKKRGGKVC
jgi:hypothetical protein